ncbi:hypothetical protein [Rhodoferax sp.]|uniref:hypothetical protein n=1 Tax=Rhodoferax sp. TaxID=50421 RepID=UPI00284E4E29|nr:hypothetical protein [Rhodoferax sp.]MDR3369935.1 hypothetical protein [Rhodoferax sp.]
MSDVLLKLLGFVVRVGLLLAALVFFASLMAAGFVILILWLLRALWAKLTGQPVSPWTFQVNRQAVWQRFNQRGFGQPGGAPMPDNVVDAEVKDVTDVAEVTDVEPKRIVPPH